MFVPLVFISLITLYLLYGISLTCRWKTSHLTLLAGRSYYLDTQTSASTIGTQITPHPTPPQITRLLVIFDLFVCKKNPQNEGHIWDQLQESGLWDLE